MSIEPGTGILHASHNENGSNGNAGTLRASTNSGNTAIGNPLIQFIDPIITSDIYYSHGDGTASATTGAARWAVSSLIGQAGDYMDMAHLGGIYVYGPNGGTLNLSGDGNDGGNGQPVVRTYNTLIYSGESTWYNASTRSTQNTGVVDPRTTDQFLNPHIITSYIGGNEHIHVSYFDDKDKSIKYRYNRRGGSQDTLFNIRAGGDAATNAAATNAANAIPKVWTNLDGGFDGEDTAQLTSNAVFPAVDTSYRVVNYNTRNPIAVANRINAGEHNAIAVTSQGYPVIAYYDATNQKLKLAVSGAVNPVDSRNWVIVDVLPEGNAYKFGTGQYVSIAIDSGKVAAPAGGTNNVEENRIHIAARNINGNLVYIRGLITPPTPSTATGQYTADGGSFALQSVQVVDSVGTVGRWCKISLDEYGNPWIAYQDDGYLGGRDGAKLAYLNTDRFTKGRTTFAGEDIDLNGTSITGWEAMHIPTRFRVENPSISGRENGRLGMECFPTRNVAATGTQTWGAAVSYFTTFPTTKYRIVYYVK
jgi:hypothetical protein